jgi:hypothetical protein
VELGVSALTRRDRLERIASAERDRRAGRVELAMAVLGEGSEWPARVVLALAKLPEGEGDESRVILEESLDTWAADIGLAPLNSHSKECDSGEAPESKRASGPFEPDSEYGPASAPDVQPEWELDVDSAEEPTPDREWSLCARNDTMLGGDLDAPIDNFELDRAFAEAEAQTDEMHDANRVAERVLMAESMGLSELSGDAISVLAEEDCDVLAADEQPETDAAWAPAPVWPEPTPTDETAPLAVLSAEPPMQAGAARGEVLETLERWLANLEKGRAGRAR